MIGIQFWSIRENLICELVQILSFPWKPWYRISSPNDMFVMRYDRHILGRVLQVIQSCPYIPCCRVNFNNELILVLKSFWGAGLDVHQIHAVILLGYNQIIKLSGMTRCISYRKYLESFTQGSNLLCHTEDEGTESSLRKVIFHIKTKSWCDTR